MGRGKQRVVFSACPLWCVVACLGALGCGGGEGGAAAETSLPRGHLEPIGGHTDPVLLPEVDGQHLPPQEFFAEYVAKAQPVVLRGAMRGARAHSQWSSAEQIRELYGDQIVRLEGRFEKRTLPPNASATLRDYFDLYVEQVCARLCDECEAEQMFVREGMSSLRCQWP